jgi:hypothetical protein
MLYDSVGTSPYNLGIEPSASDFGRDNRTNSTQMERVTRFELARYPAWKAGCLPNSTHTHGTLFCIPLRPPGFVAAQRLELCYFGLQPSAYPYMLYSHAARGLNVHTVRHAQTWIRASCRLLKCSTLLSVCQARDFASRISPAIPATTLTPSTLTKGSKAAST